MLKKNNVILPKLFRLVPPPQHIFCRVTVKQIIVWCFSRKRGIYLSPPSALTGPNWPNSYSPLLPSFIPCISLYFLIPPQRGIAILGGWMGVREREGTGHQGGRSCPRTSLRPPSARPHTCSVCDPQRDTVAVPQRHCGLATETLCVPHRDTGQKKVS